MQTPVDMTAYQRAAEPMAPPRPGITPSITRRPPIEMPLAQQKVAVGQNAGEVPLSNPSMPGEFDLNLELDVPAFLRRNEG
jgi:hypothetical protein